MIDSEILAHYALGLGVEGPGRLMASVSKSDDTDEQVLRVARNLEREPSVVRASKHLLAVARRPA
jgi:hypothetical protein